MYKLNFVESIEREGCKINIYTNDYYEVGEHVYKNFVDITISRKNEKGAMIYVKNNIRAKRELLGFEIQTISYGALTVEELQEKIKGYQIAIETVKELNKMFLNK